MLHVLGGLSVYGRIEVCRFVGMSLHSIKKKKIMQEQNIISYCFIDLLTFSPW